MELNSSTDETEYLRKLDKCLTLILNDQPDHQDDTIISKLLDSLQTRIGEESKRGSTHLIDQLRTFISSNIFDSDLSSKEADVVKFCFDLISLTLTNSSMSATYLSQLLACLDQYTGGVNLLSDLNPTLIISLIRVLCLLDADTTQGLLNQYRVRLDSRFLEIAPTVLNVDSSPSVYLRREFVRFYLSLLKTGEAHIDALAWSNLDVVVEFVKHQLTSPRFTDDTHILDENDVVSRLKSIGEEFSQKQMDFLIEATETSKNETQIESFAWMTGFSILIAFMSPSEMDQFHNQKEALLNEKFSKTLNKICNHLATKPLNEDLVTVKHYRARLNLTFTFVLSLYSFLDEDTCLSSSSLSRTLGFDFRPAREALKYKLAQYLCTPLYVKMNRSTTAHSIPYDNYVILLNELDLSIRQLAVSLAVSALRNMCRRFKSSAAARILDFVDSSQIIYLFKHDGVDAITKSNLFNLCTDIFSSISYLNSSQTDYMISVYKYIVDSNLDLSTHVFRFISESLTRLQPPPDLDSLAHRLISSISVHKHHPAELNCMQLMQQPNDTNETAETSKLGALLEFMSGLMNSNQVNGTKFDLVWRLLKRDDFRLLRMAFRYLITDDDNDEALNDLRQSIYMLLNGILKILNLKSERFEAAPLTSSTIQMLEKKVSTETEAFVRREMIAFLSSYHMNRLHHNTNHSISSSSSSPSSPPSSPNLSFFTSVQFFARTLAADLDWQCQLNCVTHLAAVIRLVTSDLDTYDRLTVSAKKPGENEVSFSQQFTRALESATPIEVVFTYSDCLPTLINLVTDDESCCHDRCVVAAVVDLLISIKQNDLLVQRLNSSRLDAIEMSTLESMAAELKLSTDLYLAQPVAVLDDIISSYQFDIDDEKAVDCY